MAHLRPEGLAWTAPLPPRTAAMQALSRLPASPAQAGASTGRTPHRRRACPRPSTSPAPSTPWARGTAGPGVRVVVTDFVEPDGRTERPYPWERPLRRLAQRHEVLVVEVVDPRELTLPDVGPVVLVDPETGHRCEVWTSSARLRHEYAELAAAHRAAVAAAVRAAGAGHLVLRTDRDWVDDLARHVVGRRPRSAPAAGPGAVDELPEPVVAAARCCRSSRSRSSTSLQRRRQSSYAVRFASLPMLERLVPRRPRWRRHLPAALLLLALASLGLAAGRPAGRACRCPGRTPP